VEYRADSKIMGNVELISALVEISLGAL